MKILKPTPAGAFWALYALVFGVVGVVFGLWLTRP